MLDLSVIIVNYNVKEFLLNLLESIGNSKTNFNFETIVIDNNSSDGSVEAIKKDFPGVRLIESADNLGFGKANNLGINIAEGRYILLLNPDTLVSEDTFQKMIDYMDKNPEVGLSGCKVLNPDGSLQLPCRRSFPGPWTSFTKITGLSKLFPRSKFFAKYNLTYLDENETYEVDAVSGSFMMIRKEALEKVKGFDPDFFMYGEDLDLCYRIKLEGWKVTYFHETSIIHYKGESTKRSSIDETKHFYEAMQLFVNKHLSNSLALKIILKSAIKFRELLALLFAFRLPLIAIILDFIFFSANILLAEKIYNPGKWSGFPEFTKPYIYLVPSFLQVITSSLVGAYNKKSFSVYKALLGLFVGFLLITSATFFLKQFAYSRALVVIVYVLSGVTFAFWRIVSKVFFKIGLYQKSSYRRYLIVGTNENAISIGNKLSKSLLNINTLVGYIRKDYHENDSELNILGSLENLKKVIEQNRITDVIFSPRTLDYSEIFKIISECNLLNVDFKIAGSSEDFIVGKSEITILDDIPLLNINYNITAPFHKVIKRIFDIVSSFFLLVLVIILSPVLILFLAKRLLDIISNLFSIFTGKISFVGPENENSSELYLGKRGITGYWKLNDFKDISKEELDKLDIYYAKNQNIWLDLEIIGKTIADLISRGR